jgi:1,4-alpha-glucan branching enzyme
MKTKAKTESKSDRLAKRQTLHIEFHDGQAQAVCIAGSFNDWHPSATPMLHMSHDRWVKELSLPPGRYEYRLVVDGQWLCDPAAAEKVPNPFGGCNAVLVVPSNNGERRQQP